MADDSNQELKIHIVSDADNSGFKSAAAGAENLNREMGVVNVTQADADKITSGLSDKTVETGKSFEKLSLHGREAHHVIRALNQAVPELGLALQGLLTEAGPWVVAILAIKEAMELWQGVQDAAKAKNDALAASLDKTRTATHAAMAAQTEYNAALADAGTKQDDYLKKLGDTQKILEAQFTVKKNLLEIDKATDLSAAKTPAEKEAVRARYSAAEGGLAQSKDAANIDAITNQRIALQNQKNTIEQQVDAINNNLSDLIARSRKNKDITLGYGTSPEDAETIQHMAGNVTKADIDKASADAATKIKELTKTLDELNKQSAELADKYKMASTVGSIAADGRVAADNRIISRGAEGADAVAHGQKLSQEQIAANAALTQLFAAHIGGIQQLMAIIRYHLEHSTTQAAEINALKNALAILQRQTNSLSGVK